MSILIIASSRPYDGIDTVWNALRLAGTLIAAGNAVRLFVMNDSIDIVRANIIPPEDSFDLLQMIRELIEEGVVVRACGTFLERSGSNPGGTAIEEVLVSDLNDLSNWIRESDRVLTF